MALDQPLVTVFYLALGEERKKVSIVSLLFLEKRGKKTNLEQRTDMPMAYLNYFKGPTLTTPLFGYRREIGYYV